MKKILYPKIASELQKMVDIDQKMRLDFRKENAKGKAVWDSNIDIKNTERLKVIIDEIGFPTTSLIGKKGTFNAWLLVQHAVHDVLFQEKYLESLKKLPPEELKLNLKKIAFLEDRIRTNNNLPQIYGTQFTKKDGKYVPLPIEDEEHVDERRAKMGLDTLEDNLKLIYKNYGKPKKESK